ncbi:MAG: UDP-N-acetylmuramoyl-L-alanyl-D-glutamate--2,6-diaminopimelate ligase [Haliscomenobacter sp.]|nr:UDP-N-acetylmuramoyl-L-alanyl-D-glutamate--2,6-diaminopimelate ligase [Haliscomenobacter sp.]
MLLKDLIPDIMPLEISGNLDREIGGLVFDSRQAAEGSVFVAVRGIQSDGHQYIDQAVRSGAAAVVAETLPDVRSPEVTYIRVANSAKALGFLAHAFYDRPSAALTLVGVTGTNGKTTTVTLLHQLFSGLGYKCGLISTVENRIGDRVLPSAYTTPDAVFINRLLEEMADAGCSYAFMEVSSHAADQQRIAGLQFAGGVFTNITHDHLDYHETFDRYIQAKKGFFDTLPKEAFALVNVDDKRGMVMVQNTKAKVFRFGMLQMADFKGKVLDNSLQGLHLDLNGQQIHARLIGGFNAYNLLAAYGVALCLGQEPQEVLVRLSQVESAEGRFDYLVDPKRDLTAVVDYAHTPDALDKVLRTMQGLKKGNTRIIAVFGCGGDRDRTKRPEMARIACTLSDQVVITSDNPRSEDPEAIIREIEQGIPKGQEPKVLSITDRKEAIRTACRLAAKGDLILVAGKGHEKYQEIKGVKYPFDDKEVLKAALPN